MASHHIDKNVNSFTAKNVSSSANVVYSTAVIVLVLVAASNGGFSINSKACSPNADTIFYRINTTIRIMENQFWSQGIAFLRQRSAKLRRVKSYIIIDETHDSYTGRIFKKEKEGKLTSEEKRVIRYIHTFKPKDGDTGSYKYLVFALVYGNSRRVLRVKALRRKEKYKDFIIATLVELRKEVDYECALFDRGFYDGRFVDNLKHNKIPFILHARISARMKREFGFYRQWRCYRDFPIGKDGKGDLVLGVDFSEKKRRKWAFITNIAFDDWSKVRETYKRRWNIENIFKATDGIQLRAQTNDPIVRMFCVCLSFLFYNAWQAKYRRNSLLNFIMQMLEYVFKFILRTKEKPIQFYRDKLRINIPFWDRIVASI